MTRLEKINELRKLEQTKAKFEGALNDISDSYCKEVSMHLYIDSDAFDSKRKYVGGEIDVTKPLLKFYIKKEIETLENEINKLIGAL